MSDLLIEPITNPFAATITPPGSKRLTNRALVLANAREAETLTALPAIEAARALAQRYAMACVKLEAEGAVLAIGGQLIAAAATPVQPVDTTGAGDAFDGVLLAQLARGADPESALQAACEAGARSAASADSWP